MNVFNEGRDERTEQVENSGFRIGYGFLLFGVLLISAYRGRVLHQETWDLLGLVMGAGLIPMVYQATHRALPRGVIWVVGLSAVFGAVIAVVLTLASR